MTEFECILYLSMESIEWMSERERLGEKKPWENINNFNIS